MHGGQGVSGGNLITHYDLVPRLRMCGATLPFPYSPSCFAQEELSFIYFVTCGVSGISIRHSIYSELCTARTFQKQGNKHGGVASTWHMGSKRRSPHLHVVTTDI